MPSLKTGDHFTLSEDSRYYMSKFRLLYRSFTLQFDKEMLLLDVEHAFDELLEYLFTEAKAPQDVMNFQVYKKYTYLTIFVYY